MKYSLLLLAVVLIFSNVFALDIAIDAERDAFYDGLTGPADGWIYLPHTAIGTLVTEAPFDDEDCSGLVWFSWDENYLYCYAEITDDIILVNNSTTYENDCLELKMDPDPLAGLTTGVAAVRLTAWGEDWAEAPDGVDNLIAGNELDEPWEPVEGEDYARKEVSTDDRYGYNLEFRLPFDVIVREEKFVDNTVGGIMGLGVNLHDNDESARDVALRWASDMDDLIWNEPVRHGTLTFLEGNKVNLSTENAITGVDTNTIDYQPAGGGGPSDELPEPVLFFDFEETEGMEVIDQGTAQNNGEIVDEFGVLERVADGIITRPGEAAHAIEFVEQDAMGQLGYVRVPFIDNLNAPSYTISCWMLYTGENTNWGYLFWADGEFWEPDVVDRHIDVWLHPFDGNTTLGVDCILHCLDDSDFRVATNPPEDGINIGDFDWHQVTCVLEDNIFYSIYIDGMLVAEGEGTDEVVDNIGDDLWLGARPNNADATTAVKMVGLMDRVRFWDQALTPEQIEYLYLMEGPDGGSVGVEEKVTTPVDFALKANFPNPFNPTTTISYSLDKTQNVSVEVFDMLGHKVSTLTSGVQTAGDHFVQWNGTNDYGQPVSSGVYLYRLISENRVETRKMMLLK